MIQLILPERTPATKGQHPGRSQDSTEIGESRRRIIEGHYAEPGEHGIGALRRKIQTLSVRLDQAHLAERLCSLPGDCQKLRRNIHADDLSFRSDLVGELKKGLPSSAPDIENSVSRIRTQCFGRPQSQRRKLKVDQ